jgi:beta-N-acetylhexosaminidase
MDLDLDSLPLAEKVGQLFFIGIPGPVLDQATKELLDEVRPGGICLFARNIREASQTRELLDSLREYLGTAPLLSLDQEGGTVDRLRRIMTPMPAAGVIQTTDDARKLAAIIAETLRVLGFNMDFAPVVDVVDEPRSQISRGLASRTFGHNKDDAASLAGEFLWALQADGIVGCLKHFPGLGAATVDSHEELPRVEISDAEFSTTDLYPYLNLMAKGPVRAVMIAHAAYPGVSLQETAQNGKLLPSSLSYNFVTTLLRGQLAFDGLVITDDLEMGAIVKNYGIAEASNMAIAAGVDMLAICADPASIRSGFQSVLRSAEASTLDRERIDVSLERISRIKQHVSAPIEFDPDRLSELSSRINHLAERLGR